MSEGSTRIAVTGGLGGVGSWVVDRLAGEGYDVLSIDVETPDHHVEGVQFVAGDLTDAGETFDLLYEFDPDGVVHLAGIPDPTGHAGTRVFETNTLSTYNVLVAAGRLGADVAWTSSESAYGFPFSESLVLPDYVPVDESHPMRPEDPYGTSKVAGEEVAEMVVRRFGIQVASVRPSWVQYPGEYEASGLREAIDVADVEPGTKPPGSGNFWSYVDVRDLVDLLVRAVEADVDGHEPYLCHAAENYMGVETTRLIESVRAEPAPDLAALSGEQCAFTTQKARDELGWEPQHTWREAEDASVEGPSFV
ncbi:NAD-dependent epimerase/dehydratase family protein [Haloarchaeobius amylolyticus]|uniref:NAD-dependent epimerase/dehydratase family protein n=1 Tax=Haloarchaeobius amylolyticus TaxID=1198296 RepID=UPI0022703756|nr:NAD(P)-dependent oxidoreductase [Haloarchaeobius amylolyticus]